jgi:GT2 family glycosyltransferase
VRLLGPGTEIPVSPMPAPLLTYLASLASVPPVTSGADVSLSVVIPTRGRRGQVCRLLAALEQQSYRGRTETVVVVDGDVDGTATAIERLSLVTAPRVVVLEGEDGRGDGNGAAFARNRGAEAAVNDVLVFLDDDVTPLGPHLLAAHAAVHSTGDVLGIGPYPVDLRDERGFFAQMVRGWSYDQTVRMLDAERLHFTDVLSGNMSINRSTFDGIGGFTEMPRREDWDFGCAAELAGLRVEFVGGAGAWHEIDASVAVALADRRREGAGDIALVRRFPSAAAALPLTKWRQAPWSVELHMHLAIRNPERVDALCAIGLRCLRLYEGIGARGQYRRLVDRLSLLCYWAGVGEAVGGFEGWSWLVDVIENARPMVQRDLDGGPGDVVPGADIEVVQDGEPIGWLAAEFAGGVGNPDFDKWAMAHFLHEAGAPREPAS